MLTVLGLLRQHSLFLWMSGSEKKNRLGKSSTFLVMGLEIYLIVKQNHDSCKLDRVVKLMYKRGQSHAISRRQNDESMKDFFMYQPHWQCNDVGLKNERTS